MAKKAFTEADMRKVYAECEAAGKDAAADFGECCDEMAYEMAACVIDAHPDAVAYLKKVKRVQDVQGHLADYV
jgi:hypothetical protein